MVAAGLGLEAALPARTRRAVGRHPVAERRRVALEAAVVLVLSVARVVPDTFDEEAHLLEP